MHSGRSTAVRLCSISSRHYGSSRSQRSAGTIEAVSTTTKGSFTLRSSAPTPGTPEAASRACSAASSMGSDGAPVELAGGALAPREDLLAADLLAQLEDAVHEGLGPRRTAGHEDVHGDDLVDALDRVVAPLHVGPAAAHAGAHRDDVARLGHLVVEAAHAHGHLRVDRAGHDDEVALPR